MEYKIIRAVEFWDGLLFEISNFIRTSLNLFRPSWRKVLRKNSVLKDKFYGESCYIVLNSPSIKNHDLTLLEEKNVICVNHFIESELYNSIKPNIYVATDTSFFSAPDNLNSGRCHVTEIVEATRNTAICIFAAKFLENYSLEDHVFIMYGGHKCTQWSLRSDMTKPVSMFGTVALSALNAALFLGFKRVYFVGFELPPWSGGLMPHVHKETANEIATEQRLTTDISKHGQTQLHWQYFQAQLESYYLAEKAKKKGVKVFNCCDETKVHAFPYTSFSRSLEE